MVLVMALILFIPATLRAGANGPSAVSPVSTQGPGRKPAPAVFVTNPTLNSLSVFPAGSNGNVASLFTLTHLSAPHGIAYWAGNLYVVNGNPDSITAYPANAGRRPNPIITISGGNTHLYNPVAIALDSAGNMYVANEGSQRDEPASITIYRAGSKGDVAPIARIAGAKTDLKSPSGVAVDSSGYIYVTNDTYPQEPDSITVYSPGSTGNSTPVRVISGPATKLASPGGIAVDSSGNIFVTSLNLDEGTSQQNHAAILLYAPGSTGNVAPMTSVDGDCATITAPGALALGPNGNLYVTNPIAPLPESVVVLSQRLLGTQADPIIWGPISVFFEYAALTHVGFWFNPYASRTTISPGPQCVTPISNIVGDKTEINGAWGIAVDPDGNIYVTNSESNSIGVFQPGANGNVAPSLTIESPNGVEDSNAVAVDSEGKIYVANGGGEIEGREAPANTVTIYPAGSYANVKPIATLGSASAGDDSSGISMPGAIAVDRSGRIFVANETAGYNLHGNITVYPAGSNGDVKPIATIGGTRTGDNTGLNDPVGLGFDSASNLYVLNSSGGPDTSGSITVYPPTANGNVVPKATIANGVKDKQTKFESPAGMALDVAGNIYVTNDGSANGGSDSDSITIYAAGKFGDVAPIKIISGPDTGLNLPHGIGIDSDGKIYVANDGSDNKGVDSVSVYAPGSSGDAKPIAVIRGSLTGLGKPGGLAVGP
jgi:sugar lactone lactonase YvrE